MVYYINVNIINFKICDLNMYFKILLITQFVTFTQYRIY